MVSPNSKNTVNLAQKWKLDMNITKAQRQVLCDPPGYSAGTLVVAVNETNEQANEQHQVQQRLLSKRAWETALAPVKALPMNGFMLYMAGSSISIFPIMMLGMMAWRPFKALMALNQTFKGIEEQLGYAKCILPKLVFIIGNLAAVAFATYKCQAMGLLPTHASDWLDFVAQPVQTEFATAGFAFS